MNKPENGRAVTLQELSPLWEEILRQGGEIRFTPAGSSMRPLLRGGRDVVVLRRPNRPLRKHDCPLYKRADGSYVLHRVVGIDPDGYRLRGDNQWDVESGVQDEQVCALLTAVERGGRVISCNSVRYRLYCRLLPVIRFCRRGAAAIKHRIRRKS